MQRVVFLIGLLGILSFSDASTVRAESDQVFIAAGKYKTFEAPVKKSPIEKDLNSSNVEVNSFFLDRHPVTNNEFLNFVNIHTEWRRSKVKRVFADAHYLEDWPTDLSFRTKSAKVPVTRVSWFAATAYCESIGKDLPTTAQWEFTLFDRGRGQETLKKKILEWYGKPSQKRLAAINTTGRNEYGVSDLGTLVWEWTQDFSSFLSASDSRDTSGKGENLFCGSGSQLGDPSDYAAFMRYSFRASLKANFTTSNLGFRCARMDKQ